MSARKRTKTDKVLEWAVTFEQLQGFRTLVDVVGNILTRVSFRIMNTGNGHVLGVDSIDPKHVCMIQARLECQSEGEIAEEISFCVDSSVLNTCLKSVPPHYSLTLSKYSASDDIELKAFEICSNSHTTSFVLHTLLDDSQTTQLSDLSYDYTVDIDLITLRQIVKMGLSLKSETIDMQLSQPPHDKAEFTTFTVSSSGDAMQSHTFHSSSTNSDGKCVLSASTDTTAPPDYVDAEMVVKYSDSFSSQYLSYFLKSMERQVLTMKMSQDKPLILTYPLGVEKSYILFVLAPQLPDQ